MRISGLMHTVILLFKEHKEGAEKVGEPKPKKDGEVSGEESNRSTSRTREKSHRSDKVRHNYILLNGILILFLYSLVMLLSTFCDYSHIYVSIEDQ